MSEAKHNKSGRLALRVSGPVRDRIQAVADASRWSVSTVIEVCLENYLPIIEKEVADAIAREAVCVVLAKKRDKKPSLPKQ